MTDDFKQQYIKTAQVLSRQKETIASLQTENKDLKNQIQTFTLQKKAVELAELAAEMGHIPEDHGSVKKFASDLQKSGKSLEVIEESLKLRVPQMTSFEKGAEEIGTDPADPFKGLVEPYFG